jgi:hypothetical protein
LPEVAVWESQLRVCLKPEPPRDGERLDGDFKPPNQFVAVAVELAMVSAAKRDGELVADLTSKRTGLCKAQVMGIARFSATDQTRLIGDISDMLAVARPSRLGKRQPALVDRFGWLVVFRRGISRLGA